MNINPFVVLLVEGERENADVIRKCFNGRLPSVVHHVSEQEEALDFLLHRGRYAESLEVRPHVVLLDQNLPNGDGMALLKKIKENSELSSIPVVVLSESGRQADLARALEFQANSFLMKPADFNDCNLLMDDLKLFWPDCSYLS